MIYPGRLGLRFYCNKAHKQAEYREKEKDEALERGLTVREYRNYKRALRLARRNARL